MISVQAWSVKRHGSITYLYRRGEWRANEWRRRHLRQALELARCGVVPRPPHAPPLLPPDSSHALGKLPGVVSVLVDMVATEVAKIIQVFTARCKPWLLEQKLLPSLTHPRPQSVGAR
jgi:hypothetical protein